MVDVEIIVMTLRDFRREIRNRSITQSRATYVAIDGSPFPFGADSMCAAVMIRFNGKSSLIYRSGQIRAAPVASQAGNIGKRVVFLKIAGDRAESCRINDVQLAAETERVTHESTLPIWPGGQGIIDLPLVCRSPQSIGSDARAEQFCE